MRTSICIFFTVCLFIWQAAAQYVQKPHVTPDETVIPISQPGCYDKPGATYMLVNDISSPRSVLFLGKDVTLDLNGYTITFADTCYEHIPNFSFEEGLNGWDVSKAPNAKVVDTKVHVFVGDKMLSLSKGEEIVSSHIRLPVAGRSYMAMCGIAIPGMKVSVYVEDEQGRSVICQTDYIDGKKQSCPVEQKSPLIGGGFVLAHLTNIPDGNYRIRVKADTDCLIDYVDICPSMDVGVGIVEKTAARGHVDHTLAREAKHGVFFDYTVDPLLSLPVKGIPVVSGKGSVTIRNGRIKNGTRGVMTWGIQSTAEEVMVILDNMEIINSGINATAADLLQANITNSTFRVDNPHIVRRGGSDFYVVDLQGSQPSEVSFCEFYGGQGCLVFKGPYSKIHHNLFVNRQTVVNHYSIMAMGDSSFIYNNVIKPEIGSGIEVYINRGMEIFNNEIHTKAAPPNTECGHEEFSTSAIRIADYNKLPGDPTGCFENKIYNNKIFVTGFDYPEYTDYTPLAFALFYSASAGDNYIFGNDIVVEDLTPDLKNITSAFYIGGGSVRGGSIGGVFNDNRITTNVPSMWIGSWYGSSTGSKIHHNTIIKSDKAKADFQPFRMGWEWAVRNENHVAKDIVFNSNEFKGFDFGISATDQHHSYSVWWTLEVVVTDKKGKKIAGSDIQIMGKDGKEILKSKTNEHGVLLTELKEYAVDGEEKNYSSPYTVVVGKKKEKVTLNHNKTIYLTY